jgi:hypothetical protein
LPDTSVPLPAPTLEAELKRIDAAADRVLAGGDLAANLADLYRMIVAVSLEGRNREEVRRSAPAVIRGLFEMRMRIADRIPAWHEQGLITRQVQKGLRDAFRAGRYAADMLGEVLVGGERLPEDGRTNPFFDGAPGTQVHPDYAGKAVKFRSGDVLLVRGRRHNSAAIARIGDIDSQYSHVCIVYVDEAGKEWVIESLIEEGATINTLEHELTHGIGRAALFRHNNPARAEAAAAMITSHVRKAKLGKIPHIPYDFTMRPAGYKELFCSKLVRQAYDMASAGTLILPAYTTRLAMETTDFFHRVGVKAVETFAPGDLEVEPSFDLVAEWQDYRATSALRLQDLIMTKFFEWMDTHHYRFHEDLVMVLVGIFGRFSSQLSERVKDLLADVIPKIPSNMPRRTIQTIAMLHKTAEPILQRLIEIEDEHLRRTGNPLHPREVFLRLEAMRERSGGQIGYFTGRRWRVPGLRKTPQAAPEI